ncbi:MAG: deoxyribose-phosphate aldolase [Eubacterium sp.]|nr:deoxyribose-phosphate aldolase [Eubacterium sp.]
MDIKEILSKVDHTLLKPQAPWEDMKALVDDAIEYGTASVCIPPSYVSSCARYAAGRMPICTVIGFPNGYSTSSAKIFEAVDAVEQGAEEIDAVINIGDVKSGNYDRVKAELIGLRKATEGHILKIIIECCLLTEEEKIELCKLVSETDADFIKTSTGFSTGGATFEDVKLMREHCSSDVRIKAAGGISSIEDAEKFISLGADRLGTSRIVAIAKGVES